MPVALEYQPQLIIVSAGFDAHLDDPIGGMRVTENGFAYITDIVCEIAEKTCAGKVILLLEGGYDLGAMRKSVKAVLGTMMNGISENMREKIELDTKNNSSVSTVIKDVIETHRPFWKCFNNVLKTKYKLILRMPISRTMRRHTKTSHGKK